MSDRRQEENRMNPVTIVKQQNNSIAETVTPMRLLQIAVGQGADLDRLQKFMDMQERWEANEARKAFNNAFAAFKSEAVSIIKTTEVKDGPLKGKMHANLHDVVVAVTPALSKHGLSMSWKLSMDEKDWIEVTCNLRHVSGHSESVSMGAAPDTGPGRNAIQSRASSKSYLERYTATAILGLAAKDADDDGNGGKSEKLITESQAADLRAIAEEVGADRDKFLAYMKVDNFSDIPVSKYKKAVAALEAKRKQ